MGSTQIAHWRRAWIKIIERRIDYTEGTTHTPRARARGVSAMIFLFRKQKTTRRYLLKKRMLYHARLFPLSDRLPHQPTGWGCNARPTENGFPINDLFIGTPPPPLFTTTDAGISKIFLIFRGVLVTRLRAQGKTRGAAPSLTVCVVTIYDFCHRQKCASSGNWRCCSKPDIDQAQIPRSRH